MDKWFQGTIKTLRWALEKLEHPADIPRDYVNWWWNLWVEDPQHLVVETLLFLSLVWIVFFKKTPKAGMYVFFSSFFFILFLKSLFDFMFSFKVCYLVRKKKN